ncbi:ROK family transcriptional regulator [Enterococcus sp. LJL128]
MSSRQNHPIKLVNKTELKAFLFSKEFATQAELAEGVHISVVTVNNLVKELVAEGWFVSGNQLQKDIGRPSIRYFFNYNRHFFLLLSIQAFKKRLKVLAKVVNLKGLTIFENEYDFSIVDLTHLSIICSKLYQKYPKIHSISIALPGRVHQDTVTSSWYDQMNGWNFKKEINNYLSLPIFVQNDANLATIGFFIRKKIDRSNIIVGIYFPEGEVPGISIFYNNHLFLGNQGLAGEVKYLPALIDESAALYWDKLIELVAVYNGIIAPHHIVVFNAESFVTEEEVLTALSKNSVILKQPNKPKIQLSNHLTEDIFSGLHWLSLQNSIYFSSLMKE